ncbi:MAG TPA: hypothetical protein VMV79_04340, partial [Alphaproteobacteria bacterium]|nr:hypothetical protein [Alphaproteobacteria bacterium]
RVAGDILYGGAFGVASAVTGAMTGVANATLESETGKDAGGLAMASLFGPDKSQSNNAVQFAKAGTSGANQKPATQIASAAPLPAAPGSIDPGPVTVPPPVVPPLQNATPPGQVPLLAKAAIPASPPVPSAPSTPSSPSTPTPVAATIPAPTPAASLPAAPPAATATIASAAQAGAAQAGIPGVIPLAPSGGKFFPLRRSDWHTQPFGGVMPPPSKEAQAMALMVARTAPGTRIGRTIYTNPLMKGPSPLATLPAHTAALPTANAMAATPAASAAAETAANRAADSGLPPALLDDIAALKALKQYNNVAGGAAATGANLNVAN